MEYRESWQQCWRRSLGYVSFKFYFYIVSSSSPKCFINVPKNSHYCNTQFNYFSSRLVRWRDTDYEAPRGVTELEAIGLRSHSVLLYGQAMGESRVTVCLQNQNICTDFNLHVIASVVLMPATASIAPGDTLRYK